MRHQKYQMPQNKYEGTNYPSSNSSVSFQAPPAAPPIPYPVNYIPPQQHQQQFHQNRRSINSRIVSQQYNRRMEGQGPQQFINPLCGCAKEFPVCLLACCLPWAINYFHAIAVEKATKGKYSCSSAFFVDCCCCCCINRKIIRQAFSIEGNCCNDCCVMFWCQFCASLQDYYESNDRY